MADIQLNPGEVIIKLNEPKAGKISLSEFGLDQVELVAEGGNLRFVFDISNVGEHHYFKVPTLEFKYSKEIPNTHWQCEFNDETILDKVDHFGNSTILLLDRKKLAALEHHHENKLIVHIDLSEEVTINASESFVNLFK